jgi:hypothetical protein
MDDRSLPTGVRQARAQAEVLTGLLERDYADAAPSAWPGVGGPGGRPGRHGGGDRAPKDDRMKAAVASGAPRCGP